MQQRSEPHHSLDDFPTPPWATRALCRALFGHEMTSHLTCREPAANRGHMARTLAETFGAIEASDIFDYGAGYPVRDFLWGPSPKDVDWTITNPPFRLASAFIERALSTSRHGVAMLVRSAFLEGITRHRELFLVTPPTRILQFTERVVMHKGKLAPKGRTATAYCWLVWTSPTLVAPQFHWIAPCRKRLERASDYAGDT
jgi:hypothetical protein